MTRRRVIAAVVGVAVVAVAAVLVVRALSGGAAGDALEAYLTDWSAGRDAAAGGLTDAPPAATAGLKENRAGLDGARVKATSLDVREDGNTATAGVHVVWQVPAIGPFAYDTRIGLVHKGDDWTVHWRPSAVYPKLGATTRLGTTRSWDERAPILARDGTPLVVARPVVRVGAVAGKVDDPRATADDLARVLDLHAATLRRQIAGGGPQEFVEALVLRPGDYAKVKAALAAVPDVTTLDGEAPLAPTRAFARALLGAVAPATAEQLRRLGSPYAVGDQVGQWGLEQRFERRLAGEPTRRVVIRLDGVPSQNLKTVPGQRGRPLRTTLDATAQRAAEAALGGRTDPSAVVALQPSTGDVLAVADRPVDSTFDRALEGLYPPGSTFKVVSTAALLRHGLDPAQTVACPPTITVQGRAFRNFEGEAAGSVPFSTDFAQSCNTAFISLAPRLPADALARTGRDFGLGRRVRLPLPTGASRVPPGRSAVERGAAMIGQHTIVASPLALAGVAGTVAAGRWHAPRLVSSDPRVRGPRLPAGEDAELRSLMRSVITSGTGTALAGVPGDPAGKSGTAEYGSGDPPPTHAWFIALRGDVAVAALVEHGASGGEVAAPVVDRFFRALDGG